MQRRRTGSFLISLERVSTDKTACEVASAQLQLLTELGSIDSLLTVIVADTAYGSLEPYSEDQVVIARGRTDRQGRRPAKDDQIAHRGRGRPRKYEPRTIRFVEDLPPGSEGGSDEEYEYTDTIGKHSVDVLLNRWNDVHVEGHAELVDVVKAEIFSKNDPTKPLFPPLLLILSGKRRREITALDANQSYRRRKAVIRYKDFSGTGLTFPSTHKSRKITRKAIWHSFAQARAKKVVKKCKEQQKAA